MEQIAIQYTFRNHIISLVYFLMILPLIVQPSSANNKSDLQAYLDNGDETFSWSVKKEHETNGITLYDLLLISQEWKSGIWSHQLRVVVPEKKAKTNVGLLFITGGSNITGQPNWKGLDQDELKLLSHIAKACGTAIAILNQVPNQPLYGDRTEDDLISYSFVKYLESKDASWPLLFPMTKSAIRAMDALEAFSKEHLNWDLNQFVVSCGSKRGWTTWLTGAHDQRVVGIAPMVIDVLNMKEQMKYQIKHWGKYSDQIKDYETKKHQGTNLLDMLQHEEGDKLADMVDPYAFLEKLTMPKLIFIGSNDPYWPVDAIKHYYHDLKGESYIHYVPNAGHGLGDGKQAIRALTSFLGYFVKNEKHPSLKWSTTSNDNTLVITATAGDGFQNGHLWVASSIDRDFRNNEFIRFETQLDGNNIKAEIPYPAEGFLAAYVDAEYKGLIDGTYTKSTQMFLLTPEGLSE